MSLSTSRLKSGLNPSKLYDDEFSYDPEIESQIPDIMASIEEGNRVSGTTQTKEEAFRLHEMNVEARKEYRFADQDELKRRRTGRILHMNTFIDMLRKTGLRCWYTNYSGTKAGDTLGLFVYHEGWMLSDGCSGHKWGEPHYVGFVQAPLMQEYEELYFDQYDVPSGIRRRGWRTIGLKLIEQKLITEDKFHEVFGAPGANLVSSRYLKYLKYLRHLSL